MILGIGSDLTDMRRIARVIERHGARFLDRVFTPTEQALARARPKPLETYARRFAAKEAAAKAVGSGLWRGTRFTDFEVTRTANGAPGLVLHGAAQSHLDARLPNGMAARCHLSMTDDHPWAQAFVVIEAVDPAALGGD